MRRNITYSAIIGILTATMVISCSDKKEIDDPFKESHKVEFMSDGFDPNLGSELVVDPNHELFPIGSVLGVSAYNLPNGIFDPGVNKPDMLYNAHITKLTTGIYLYNPITNWPFFGKVKFIAYYPHSDEFPVGTIAVSTPEAPGLPSITLDLRKSRNKVDFAVASLEPLSPTKLDDPQGTPYRPDYFVNFRFKRKLSELFFRAKAVDMPKNIKVFIHSVSIKNVYRKGVYNYSSDKWSDLEGVDATSGATLSFSSAGVPVSTDKFTDIINPGSSTSSSSINRDGAVVVIPSAYDNVKVNVVYTLEYMDSDGGSEYRIVGQRSVPIKVNWEPSKMYTYDIELGFHEVSGDDIGFSFTVKPWEGSNIGTEMN